MQDMKIQDQKDESKQALLDQKQQNDWNEKLLNYIKSNDTENAKTVINKCANIDYVDNTTGYSGWNALHHACWMGNKDIVAILIKKFTIKINTRTDRPYFFKPYGNGYETPLHLAINQYNLIKNNVDKQKAYAAIIVDLIRTGANLNLENAACQKLSNICPPDLLAESKGDHPPIVADAEEVAPNLKSRRAAAGAAIGAALGGTAGTFTGPAAPFLTPFFASVGGATVSYVAQKSNLVGGLIDASAGLVNGFFATRPQTPVPSQIALVPIVNALLPEAAVPPQPL